LDATSSAKQVDLKLFLEETRVMMADLILMGNTTRGMVCEEEQESCPKKIDSCVILSIWSLYNAQCWEFVLFQFKFIKIRNVANSVWWAGSEGHRWMQGADAARTADRTPSELDNT
jgi:hypothetical protein